MSWWTRELDIEFAGMITRCALIELNIKMYLHEIETDTTPRSAPEILTITIVSTGKVLRYSIPKHLRKRRCPTTF